MSAIEQCRSAALGDMYRVATLPGGLHRIRHYGLLANAGRREHLARSRELLHVVPTVAAPPALVAAPVAIVSPSFVIIAIPHRRDGIAAQSTGWRHRAPLRPVKSP